MLAYEIKLMKIRKILICCWNFPTTFLPLVYPGAKGGQNAAFCASGSLNNTDVRGKMVVCNRGGEIASTEKGQTVKDAGGAGMILANLEIDGESTIAEINVVPAIHVIFSSGESIKAYINSTLTPRVSFVFEGTMVGIENSPVVASFSSRGPSLSSPGILKPDIIGPGVSILAACPFSVENNTKTKSTFNILSGTSMSSPDLSGIAALIKSAHPDWFQPADVFAIGAGHVNRTKALNPGLVFDIQPDDYIPYLCGLGYKEREIELIIQRSVKCSKINSITEAALNYPSFSIDLIDVDSLKYSRTVTNVGEANSIYYVTASTNSGFVMGVDPFVLNFTEVNQKLTYNVTFIRDTKNPSNATFAEGAIALISDKHFVRIPVSVKLV
ncbi:hypothetical protein ACH5RR_038538 [Cinchona calisaya]|uniref:Uncharacterized protein n=1 Tax=Cinchona calisaya TaxID=153742 RepID=A0ABD2XYQ1_9GENT